MTGQQARERVYRDVAQTRDNRVMFDGIVLPEWTSASPRNLFNLFIAHQEALALDPNTRASDELTRVLARLTMIRFHEWKFTTSLRKIGLDPDDVAAECLCSLLGMVSRTRLEHPCPKVLLKILSLRIRHFVYTAIRRAKANALKTPTSATDVGARSTDDDENPLSRRKAIAPTLDLRRLDARLRDEEERCIRDIPGNIFVIQALYRILCRHVTRGVPTGVDHEGRPQRRAGLPTHAELPERLRTRVKREQYNLLAPRVRRLVTDLVQ